MIWIFSTDAFSGSGTGRFLLPLLQGLLPGASPEAVQAMHAAVRKLAHVTEYAILGLLLVRALRRPDREVRSTAGGAVALAFAYAVLDETHQSFVASRTAAVSDVLLDTVGAAAGVLLATWALSIFSSDRRSPS